MTNGGRKENKTNQKPRRNITVQQRGNDGEKFVASFRGVFWAIHNENMWRFPPRQKSGRPHPFWTKGRQTFSGKDRGVSQPYGVCHRSSQLLRSAVVVSTRPGQRVNHQHGWVPAALLIKTTGTWPGGLSFANSCCKLCKSCVNTKQKRDTDWKEYGKRQGVLSEQWNHRYIVVISISLRWYHNLKKKLKGFNVTHSNNTLRDFAVLLDFPNKFTWVLSPTRTLCCTEQVETLKHGGSGTELAGSVCLLGDLGQVYEPLCSSVFLSYKVRIKTAPTSTQKPGTEPGAQ